MFEVPPDVFNTRRERFQRQANEARSNDEVWSQLNRPAYQR